MVMLANPIQPQRKVIKAQPGPQRAFLSTRADIAVFGGAAGGGKSVALLLDACRYAVFTPKAGYNAVIFRRTSPQITQAGGLWDESGKFYSYLGGSPKQTRLEWVWPHHETKIRFAHMQYDSDRFNWQGSQIAFLGFDELTHFSEEQFFYMLSRNRSMCGIKPRVRATTNPDADSWVKRFLGPWVDETWPEEDRAESGELRYFVRDGGQITWLPRGQRHTDAKSVTFIHSSIYDNKIFLKSNPEYLLNLKALPLVERQRLLYGDWTIRPSGNKFKRHWFEIIDAAPADMERVVRAWDKAGTEPKPGKDPDYTVGCKVGRKNGFYYVLDVVRDRMTPGKVDELVVQTAALDGRHVAIYEEQEPGSSGVAQIERSRRLLAGYEYHGIKSTGSKEIRANPVSSQAEGGNIKLVRGHWNEPFLNELTAFPMVGVHDDMVDSLSLAMEQLMPLKMSAEDHLAAINERVARIQRGRA
jgi:predicted phage terminase large subunit-like protein